MVVQAYYLNDLKRIKNRLKLVDELFVNKSLLKNIRGFLKNTYDSTSQMFF